eukprot:7216122-Alexandrium_andersonii.AAC.1
MAPPGLGSDTWRGSPTVGEDCSALWRGLDRGLVRQGVGVQPSFSSGGTGGSAVEGLQRFQQ